MTSVAAAGPAPDLSLCDREPIHIPAAIQPHGALLITVPDGSRITHASANLAEFLGITATSALGQSLASVLGDAASEILIGPSTPGGVESALRNSCSLRSRCDRELELNAYRSGDSLCIDLEPWLPERWQRPALVATQAVLDSFKDARSQTELCERAVRGLRMLTGYDRVMAYRFGDDGHGEVIAEARAPELEPYLGQRYPASDIPAQARQLYLRQRVGIIADSAYQPVPLLADAASAGAPAVDLTHSALRSVSPLHREFMRNMGTAASMTTGLARGRDSARALWGMLVCHHSTPRVVSAELRAVAAMISQVTALLLESQGAAEIAAERLQRHDTLRLLTDRLAVPSPLIESLTSVPYPLLNLLGATAVVVRINGEVRLLGRAPDPALVERILVSLGTEQGRELRAVDDLGLRFPEFEPLAALCSGALWLPLGQAAGDGILWLRPEQAQTLTWGGNPAKPATADPLTGLISPRASFVAWKEVVHGRSVAWSAADRLLAGELRRAIEEDMTRRSQVALDLFNRLFDSAPTALLLIGPAGEIRMLNATAETLFGYGRLELLGRPATLLLPERGDSEPIGRRRDGSEFPIELSISRVQPNELTSEPMLQASISDISARHEIEQQRRQVQLELEVANAALHHTNAELDQFVYSAAHDLRAPLRGIAALARFVLEDDPSLRIETRERVELIGARAERMRLLLRDILVYARAGQSGQPLVLTPVSLETLVEELFATIPMAPGFRCIADASLASIRVIAFPLVQVLRNLIENALKHHDALIGTVSIAVLDRGDHLRFAVTDDGPGIPAAYREQVFEMFATLKRRDEFEASGMGLALVRKLVRQQGGRCGIESAPLRGSCVWFEWPKLDAAHAQYLPRQ